MTPSVGLDTSHVFAPASVLVRKAFKYKVEAFRFVHHIGGYYWAPCLVVKSVKIPSRFGKSALLPFPQGRCHVPRLRVSK